MGCGSSRSVGVIADEKSPGKNDKHNDSQTEGKREMVDVYAAAIIQRWFRRKMADLQLRRKCCWKVFTEVEYKSEQEQLNLTNFFSDLDKLADALGKYRIERLEKSGKAKRHNVVTMSQDEGLFTISKETEDALFSRPHPPSLLSLEMLQELIEGVRNDKLINVEILLAILDESFTLQKKFPNIRLADTKTSHRICVVGDLHGKLNDLLCIFDKNGIPSNTNPYVFNGDFVDRGANGVEIALFIFAFQLLYPHSVFINRGNHEDFLMNKKYGFEKEVMKKYHTRASKILRAFATVFCGLPLGTIINDSVLVLHGGLSEHSSLTMLNNVKRLTFVSVLQAVKARTSRHDPEEAKQIVSALWSDPGRDDGVKQNGPRGGGTIWGPDISSKFLESHGLSLLVRSHECFQDGYEWHHDKKVLTVFSASNYFSHGSNLGAYIRFDASNQPHIVQYDAEQRVQSGKRLSLREQTSVIEHAALRDIKQRIYEKKNELDDHFAQIDPEGTGTCEVSDWVDIMTQVTGLNLPWRTLREPLVEINEGGQVEYKSCTAGLHLEEGTFFKEKDNPSLVDALYQNMGTLEFIFRLIDIDSSGKITTDEFKFAVDTLNTYLGEVQFEQDDIATMAESIDLNKDGFIDFNEFVESFRLSQNSTSSQRYL
eukprot:m.13868 g.13868  ORF g.13868 m.13868 type:complete len:654 (+) comp4942_c0_seq1:115-2076(+)